MSWLPGMTVGLDNPASTSLHGGKYAWRDKENPAGRRRSQLAERAVLLIGDNHRLAKATCRRDSRRGSG